MSFGDFFQCRFCYCIVAPCEVFRCIYYGQKSRKQKIISFSFTRFSAAHKWFKRNHITTLFRDYFHAGFVIEHCIYLDFPHSSSTILALLQLCLLSLSFSPLIYVGSFLFIVKQILTIFKMNLQLLIISLITLNNISLQWK